MKFIVSSGKVKDCVQDSKGRWVTPNNGWLVADEEGIPVDGCKVYVEEAIEVESAPVPDLTWLVAAIKEYMTKMEIDFNSGDTKADLLTKIDQA